MTRQCILCLGYENKKRKVKANLIFNLEKKLLGIDKPLLSKGIHKECLDHLLGHLPSSTKPILLKFQLPRTYLSRGEDFKIMHGYKPVWFLSRPTRFFLASGSRADGSFICSFNWFRELFKIEKTKRVEIPARIRKLLPKQCENCGKTQNLEIHHKIPLCLGGSNERENLQVLCKTCHAKSPMEDPDSVSYDFTRMLKDILETEYQTEILCFEVTPR